MEREQEKESILKIKDSVDYGKMLMFSMRNDMIQNSRVFLSLREGRIVYFMIAKIKPEDTVQTEYTFSAKECAIAMGLKGKAKYNYKELTDTIQRLSDKSWKICVDGELRIVRWFNTIHLSTDKESAGVIKVKFHEDMAPYLFNLVEQKKNDKNIYFTSYPFLQLVPMKNCYSSRLYAILLSYQYNNVSWFFDLQMFKEMLFTSNEMNKGEEIPKGWKNFAIFRRDVLEPTKKDINTYTDLTIDYVALKKDLNGNPTRGYSIIKFFMDEKTENEKQQTQDRIEMEVEGFEQLSLSFIEDDECVAVTEFVEDRKQAREKQTQQDKDKRIEKAQYKILTEEYYDFTDEEIARLYITALKHMNENLIPYEYWEIWTVDYIGHYYENIKNTPEKTRTTEFNRLIDAVGKDYDHYSIEVDDKWLKKEL